MLVLNATRWNYEADLNSPPVRWTAEYSESGSSVHLPGESTPSTGLTRVAIDVTVEGFTTRLLEGTVREWGFVERPEGVASKASGIDLKSALLDFRPASPITFRGLQLLSTATGALPTGAGGTVGMGNDCADNPITAASFDDFQKAAGQIASAAGFIPTFDCYNYILGHDVVWNTDQSANDVLAQLLAPFNATEKSKMDVFVQANGVLRFVERGRSSPSLVQIDYMEIAERTITEGVRPPVWDVQVVGPTFTAMEPDCSPTPIPGAIFVPPGEVAESYITTTFSEEREGFDAGDTGAGAQVLISDTTTKTYYAANGQVTKVVTQKYYHSYVVRHLVTGIGLGIYPKNRTEDSIETWDYKGPQGQATRHVESTYVVDNTDHYAFDLKTNFIQFISISRFSQTTSTRETVTQYDEKTGDVVHSLSSTFRGEPEAVPITQIANYLTFAQESRGLKKEQQLEEWFFWSAGQRFRKWVNRTFDRETDGKVLKTSSHIEPATGIGRQEQTFVIPATPPSPSGTRSFRSRVIEIKAGPNGANLRYSFPILGRDIDCEYFRQRILDERLHYRYEATLDMMPDLNVLEGYNVQVLNIPPRWRTSTFYVVARSMTHEPNHLGMMLRGLAWLDAP